LASIWPGCRIVVAVMSPQSRLLFSSSI